MTRAVKFLRRAIARAPDTLSRMTIKRTGNIRNGINISVCVQLKIPASVVT